MVRTGIKGPVVAAGVVFGLSLIVFAAVGQGAGSPEGGVPPAEAPAEELPFVPIAGDRLMLYPFRSDDRYYALRAGIGPGMGLGGTVAQALPQGIGLFDPAFGYFYHPGVRPNLVVVTVGTPGGEQVTYYVSPGSPALLLPQNYLPLLNEVRSLQEQAAAAPPAATVESATRGQPAASPRQAGFGSRMSSSLGGAQQVSMTFALGEAKLREGRYADAATAFQRAVAAAPGEAAPRIALSLALMAGREYSGAARALRTGLSAASTWANIRVDSATALGSADQYDAVEAQLREAAGSDSSDNDLQLLLGFLHFATGQEGDAVALLEPVSAASPQDLVLKGLVQAARTRQDAKAGGGAPAKPAGGTEAGGGAKDAE